jgi:hypothetical protein
MGTAFGETSKLKAVRIADRILRSSLTMMVALTELDNLEYEAERVAQVTGLTFTDLRSAGLQAKEMNKQLRKEAT